MLHFLTRSEIDTARWDACLQKSQAHLLYAGAGYLDVSTKKNWVAVVEMQDKEYVSVFPLPFKNRLGIQVIYQPLNVQQLGLFVTPESRERSVSAYLALIPKHFRRITLQLNTGNAEHLGSLPPCFSATSRITYHLGLIEPYETLRQNYSTNLKRSIKKAQQQNYRLSTTGDISELIALFRQARGRDLKEFKNRHYAFFEKQYRFLLENNLAEVWELRGEDGALVAGALFAIQSDKPVFLFSAASDTGKKHGAMAFLIDAFLRQWANTNAVFDFEGGSIANLARFYGSFGAKPVTYLAISCNLLPWPLNRLLK